MGGTVKFVYGRRSDGCVERCRAKPENRGRGRCPHGEHVALTDAQAQEMNQERLSEDVPGFHVGAGNGANDGAAGGDADGVGAVPVRAFVRPGAGRVGGVRVPVLVACRNLVLACSIIRAHPARSRRKNCPNSRRALPRPWMRRRGGVFAGCGSA